MKRKPLAFHSPTTTRQAYHFGKINGQVGSERLSFSDVLGEAPVADHASSLYRAYSKGWREGRRLRTRKLAVLARALNIRPACHGFTPGGKHALSGTRYCTCGYTEPAHLTFQARRAAWISAILATTRAHHDLRMAA